MHNSMAYLKFARGVGPYYSKGLFRLEFYGLSILYYTIVVGVCFRARILWAIYTIVVGAHWDQLNYTIIIGLKFYGL